MLTNDCLVLMTVLDQGGPREPSRLTDHITWMLVDLKAKNIFQETRTPLGYYDNRNQQNNRN